MDSSAWDERYASTPLVWSAEPNRFLVEEAGGLTPGRALDVACGEGRNALWLAEQGWRVTAVDFSAVALDKGRRRADERGVDVEWVHADVVAYAPERAAFDLVILFYLHLPAAQWAQVLEHAVAAVAPGGVLLVVGHDESNIAEGYGGPQDPAVLYGPDAVAARLGELDVVRAERVIRTVATDAGERHAIDVLVRAHHR